MDTGLEVITLVEFHYQTIAAFSKEKKKKVSGIREQYIDCHKYCETTFENTTYKYINSITTYSTGNIKCSIDNVYIPVRKHHLE